MKDFSYWEEYEGFSEGSGRSEKIWIQDPDTKVVGLFKFKKDVGTTDHVSECIACQLAELLDIPCARFELGSYHGREGSISYNIIEKPDQILIEGIQFITWAYPSYDAERFVDEQTKHVYSIEMIVSSIERFVGIEGFLKMLLFDYLIGNSDRHQSNWAIILDNTRMYWSPLYDNSSSLCAYIQENQLQSYLGKDQTRWKALVDTKSKSLIRCRISDEKRPTHLQVLHYLKENYREQTIKFVEKIIATVTAEQISAILDTYEEAVLSENKKELICKFLCSKVQMLKAVYFGEEK